jgi:transposase
MPKNKSYTPEFKAEAIRLVNKENLQPAKVAKDLGISQTAISNWLKLAREAAGAAGTLQTSDQQEILRLRREVRILQMEREILKKAAAFFAKESM